MSAETPRPIDGGQGEALDGEEVERVREAPGRPVDLGGGWSWADALAFDFCALTAEQTRHIAPFVVEAAWRRSNDREALLLIHGGDRQIAAELRAQWRAGDWMAWAFNRRAKRHDTTSPTRILLGLRPRGRSWADVSRDGPLPDLEPGSPEFDAPRCVGEGKHRRCGAPAALGRPYCAQHDPSHRKEIR